MFDTLLGTASYTFLELTLLPQIKKVQNSITEEIGDRVNVISDEDL